jgi:enoyl-CoA hydratase
MELMMTGDIISAQVAHEIGLVNHLVETEQEMMEKCIEILQKIFSKAPLAIGMVINCVNAAYDPEQRGYQTEANSFAQCCKTEDFKEGTSAFLEKRNPKFQGK